MGLELQKCDAEIGGKQIKGKLHLDSQILEFRGPKLRWSIKLGKRTSAIVTDGVLKVRRGSKSASFRIGEKAAKWAEKVRNPPTRATKLGLKEGQKYLIRGEIPEAFETELKSNGLIAGKGPKSCNIAFVLMQKSSELSSFDKLAKACPAGVHIWAIWPKGIEAIRQSEVIARGRKHGMGPGKGISFDETHSAMRFTRK